MIKRIADLLQDLLSVFRPESTYSASITALASAASATDIFEINGADSKVITVKRLQISGIATSAGAFSLVLLRRDTANSVGTFTAPVAVPHDSNDGVAVGNLKAYTANPTVGRLIGNLQVIRATVTTAAGAITNNSYTFNLDQRGSKGVVLRGFAQTLAINLAATTITGGSFDIDVTWTER